jgi:hypothetical protein
MHMGKQDTTAIREKTTVETIIWKRGLWSSQRRRVRWKGEKGEKRVLAYVFDDAQQQRMSVNDMADIVPLALEMGRNGWLR